MSRRSGPRIRWGLIVACLMGFAPLAPGADAAVPLAQAKPPAPGNTQQLPPNVTVQGRLYIAESIVVALLFGGAIFGVCRSSGRT